MLDAQNGQITQDEQTSSAMPTENKQTVEADSRPTEDSRTQEGEKAGALPDNASERTRQEFEKLKQHNKELAERLANLEASRGTTPVTTTTVADELRFPRPEPVNDADISKTIQDLTDKDGYLDEAKLKAVLKKNQDAAVVAQQAALAAEERVTKFEEREQMREARGIAPEFDPFNRDYNPEFYDKVVLNLQRMKLKTGKMDIVQATKEVKAELEKSKNKDKGSEKVVEQRQQINAVPSERRSDTKYSSDELVLRSRQGDRSAIYDRLKRSGY